MRWACVRASGGAMGRWLWLTLAGALWAAAGGARYADYSAVQMPQYEALNYDSPVSTTSSDESYRDRDALADVSVPLDYNDYDQTNDKRTLKNLKEEDSLQPSTKLGKKSNTVVADYIDSDYNYKSEKISPRMKYMKKRPNNVNKINIKETELVKSKTKSFRNANVNQQIPLDDEDTETPSKQFEEEEELSSDRDRSKFVRRDIRPKVRQNSREQKMTGIGLSDPDYDNQSDLRQVKDSFKVGSSDYSNPEIAQQGPNPVQLNRPSSRPQSYNSADDIEESQTSPARLSGRHRAPMPKYRKKTNEYVDYNDMTRIEKIKNLSARRTTVRSGASQRWSFQDTLHRRNFNPLPQEVAQDTTTPRINASTTVSNLTTLPLQIAQLSKDVIENITAYLNKSRHLSIAEKSQLSILKKAQRKDTAKDEMFKDKPPVLLQVTESLQTVVMVEPPVSQEPWLRARDIAEDSPERIEKVKRFMRNKLVANARNVSELMENWDDTICDYVDISMLDSNSAVRAYTCNPYRLMFYNNLLFSSVFYHFTSSF